jgi:hypothetical protein
MHSQFLVIGTNDSDCEASLALLTRQVFSTYEEAKHHADQPERAHRNPRVVECHFPILFSPTTTHNPQPTTHNPQPTTMSAVIKDNHILITLPLQAPRPSSTGKTLVVASTGGSVTSSAVVNGKPVTIGVNAYIKP